MAVDKIMTRTLVTVAPEDTVGDIYALFNRHHIHHLLVVDKGRLVGIISDRDVLRKMSPFATTKVADAKDRFTLQRRAHQIMTRDPVTVPPHTAIRDACEKLLQHRISLLPVLEGDRLEGVVSWKDILGYFIR